ncbi:MAG: L-aspartate oxidase [Thermoplasmata archaeon]
MTGGSDDAPLIVGSGIAGLYVALRAHDLGRHPVLITKSRIDESNTRYAQGGIAAAIGPGDSVAVHLADTIRAGAGLADRAAARLLTAEAPDRIADLVRLGVPFDTVEGQIALGREGAHSHARILHAGGDATGLQIEETLRRRVIEAGVELRERTVLLALRATPNRRVRALIARPDGSGSEELSPRSVVLATGGVGSLYRHSSNPSVATGEGVAIAFRAGALLSDMEFIQFHPTTFYRQGAPRFLITEALRGEGALLRTVDGRRFMPDYAPEAELAPRDVVSRAIRTEILRSASPFVLLDATSIGRNRLFARFPTVCRFLLEHGVDPSTEPIPVAPAAHFMIGGVTTDLYGRSSLPGLLACGEVAATGVHGANRLASNSLLEGLVFGERVARQLALPSVGGPRRPGRVLRIRPVRGEGRRPGREVVERVRDLMWESLGIVRSGPELARTLDELDRLGRRAPRADGRPPDASANAVLCALLIARSALAREESRGAHFRTDRPRRRGVWRRHLGLLRA